MPFSIKESKLNNEIRVKLLLQDSVPVYWPCLYVLKKMRVRSPNTQQRFLSDLLIFLAWLSHKGIDLEERLKKRPKACYLTEVELANFASQAHWKKETLDRIFSGARLHPSTYQQVGMAQAESRLITAKNYLAFLYHTLGDPDDRYKKIELMKKRFDLIIKEAKPSWKRTLMEPKGLSIKQEVTLLNSLHPDAEENPWPKSEPLRVRNYLIILLLYSLGIRRSEMLGVKLVDVDYRGNRIQIIHRPNDPDDPRVSEPTVKTDERKLPVPDPLMALINLYIERYRRSRKARSHPYLLVSHGKNEGAALSIKSVDAIFNSAKKAFPELKGVTPHTLRHHDVYKTIKSVAERTGGLPVEDRMQQERRVLTYKFGWSQNSRMPNFYGQKYYQEEADRAMKQRNEMLLDSLNLNNKEEE